MKFPPFHPDASLYCLVLKNGESREVDIGSLGSVQWPAGWTYYVGRAHYGWSSRMKRFTDENQSLHWHIDYLVDRTSRGITHLLPFRDSGDRECDLAKWLSNQPATGRLTRDFGSSDCASSCKGHGFVSERSPRTLARSLCDSDFTIYGFVQFTSDYCHWRECTTPS